MRKVLILVLARFLLCATGVSHAQDKKEAAGSKSVQQVTLLNSAWAEAVTKGDATTLNTLFADDMIVISGSGQLRDKAGEIKDAAGPPDPDFVWFHSFTTEDVWVRASKNAAVVTGIAKWGFKYKGQDVNQERRYTHVYVKTDRRWKMVAQQMSPNLAMK